jgi:hypothetical protein
MEFTDQNSGKFEFYRPKIGFFKNLRTKIRESLILYFLRNFTGQNSTDFLVFRQISETLHAKIREGLNFIGQNLTDF